MARIRVLLNMAMGRLPQILAGVLVLFSLCGEGEAQRPRKTRPQRSSAQLPPNSGLLRIAASWSSQAGVSRYRFQLARDRKFRDIILDRLVAGTEYEVADVRPGKYFWRVASLTGDEPGRFSAPRLIEPFRKMQLTVNDPPATEPVVATVAPTAEPALVREGGWRAAVGNVTRPMLVHLRSANANDLVAMNGDGVVFAIEADTGVTSWATRSLSHFLPIAVPSHGGLDNIVAAFPGGLRALHGATGRELWRVPTSSGITGGVAIALGNNSSAVFVVSSSEQKLVVLNGDSGQLLSESKLPGRVFGSPVPYAFGGTQGVLIAYQDGRVEIRDKNGNSVRTGNAQSAVSTPPLFVPAPRPLVLVGTKNGLTALDAESLRALGRVATKEDAPRGVLAAADLDGDGVLEVIMLTERGRVIAINAADGKTRWEQAGAIDAEAPAFADLNADDGTDVIVAAGQTFAMALSGRDGSVIWRAVEQFGLANHSPSINVRTLISKQLGAGFLVVGSDPSGNSLRAVPVSRSAMRPANW